MTKPTAALATRPAASGSLARTGRIALQAAALGA
ncbi:CidA/LrgA family protein, partial [Burkholderia sp. Ac-20392]|nr:CidA/LrgA family protein [Burkholderia sp. Ac-20392]